MWKHFAIAVLLLACSSLAPDLLAQDAKKDLEDLDGVWAVASVTEDGKPVPPEKLRREQLLFHKAGHLLWVIPAGKGEEHFHVTLDARPKNKAIDLAALTFDVNIGRLIKGKPVPGIYKLEMDSLQLCLAQRGSNERPSAFKSEPGSRWTLITLTRIKMEQKAARPSTPLPPLSGSAIQSQEAKKDLKDLEGTWAVVSAIDNGTPIPPEKIQGFKLAFSDEKATCLWRDGTVDEELRVRLDPKQKPKAIDLEAAAGSNKGKFTPAIYELQADSLRICLPERYATTRPSSFKSESGSHMSLVTLTRIKKK